MIKKTFTTLLMVMGVVILVQVGKHFYFKPKYVNGVVAPDFQMTLISGEKMNLSDLKGKYVLLDFWGSWCGPCRAENPALVQLFDKYKDKALKQAEGFEIVSIGIETNRGRWERAIEKDGLKWRYHASDFNRFNSEAALLYGVREIPTKYLLNPKGQIIGVNLPVNEIDALLEKRIDGNS